jgi:hypothetical protein
MLDRDQVHLRSPARGADIVLPVGLASGNVTNHPACAVSSAGVVVLEQPEVSDEFHAVQFGKNGVLPDTRWRVTWLSPKGEIRAEASAVGALIAIRADLSRVAVMANSGTVTVIEPSGTTTSVPGTQGVVNIAYLADGRLVSVDGTARPRVVAQ